jgi:translation initiation factor 5B
MFHGKRGEYISVDKVEGSMTCKIDAPNLDDAIAGSPLHVIKNDDDIDKYYKSVMSVMSSLKNMVNGDGVYVNSSSLGALEALFQYLHGKNLEIGGFRIGPVHKIDVTKAIGKKYPCILAFDVSIDDDVKKYADSVGVKIFEDKIIYKLFDSFSLYIEQLREVENDVIKDKVVFPCICEIIPEFVFNKKGPIIIGVTVKKGILKKGTPISIMNEDKTILDIGKVDNIEKNHLVIEEAVKGDTVCISIIQKEGEQQYSYGRHFDNKNMLYSKISRESIDAMKILHPDILSEREIFKLVKKLKDMFGVL